VLTCEYNVTILLHAYEKENITARFSANKQNRFLRRVYIYSCCHGTYVSLAIKTPKFVLLTCVLPFLAIKGSRVLAKKENKTQVSKLCSATLIDISKQRSSNQLI